MAHKDDLKVSEANTYKSDTQGPVSDTQAFHHATPAPGERTSFSQSGPPPAPREGARQSGYDLPKIPIQNTAPVADTPDEDGLSLPVLLGGLLMLGFAVVAGGLVVALVWFGSDTPPPEPPPEIEEVDGIPVRKGLKKPGEH